VIDRSRLDRVTKIYRLSNLNIKGKTNYS